MAFKKGAPNKGGTVLVQGVVESVDSHGVSVRLGKHVVKGKIVESDGTIGYAEAANADCGIVPGPNCAPHEPIIIIVD